MIRNLNQVSFQGFGTIAPERAQSAKHGDRGERQLLQLEGGLAQVYRAEADVWLESSEGMSVLSVSFDEEAFYHFFCCVFTIFNNNNFKVFVNLVSQT